MGGNPSATAAGASKQHSLAVGMWKTSDPVLKRETTDLAPA
jgi:hypothetical protein